MKESKHTSSEMGELDIVEKCETPCASACSLPCSHPCYRSHALQADAASKPNPDYEIANVTVNNGSVELDLQINKSKSCKGPSGCDSMCPTMREGKCSGTWKWEWTDGYHGRPLDGVKTGKLKIMRCAECPHA